MKFAVLITAHNEENYIGNVLTSLEAQTVARSSFDVVVVDNASSDRTAEIAKNWGAIVVSEPKKGIPFALNCGYSYIQNASYDWVLQTDADAVVSSKWVESFINAAKSGRYVGLTGPVYFNDIPAILQVFTRSFYGLFITVQRFLGGYTQFTGSNMAMDMKAYQSLGGIDTTYFISADVELSKRFSTLGRIGYSNGMVVGVSSRRLRKQPLKALYLYARGLFDAIRGKSSTIRLDDVR